MAIDLVNQELELNKSAYMSERVIDEKKLQKPDVKISVSALQNKLHKLGMTEEEYGSLFHSHEKLNIPLGWLDIFHKIMTRDPKDVSSLTVPLENKSFITFYVPFLLYAESDYERRIKELENENKDVMKHIDIDTIKDEFINSLHKALQVLSIKILIKELNVARLEGHLFGETSEERYIYFVEQYITNRSNYLELFMIYPVLGRLMTEKVSRSLDRLFEVLSRFLTDKNDIQTEFKCEDLFLHSLTFDLGDSHKNGQHVMVLTIGDQKLVYKPRSLSVDEHYFQFVNWFNKKGFSHPLRAPRVINREIYGWQEFIPYEECDTHDGIQRFYYRQGGNLALLYALRSVDFHNENLIACGEYPILIDLETLFDNHTDIFTTEKIHKTSYELKESVLSTMMLPIKFNHKGVIDYDLSGIAGAGGQHSNNIKTFQIENYGQDNMYLAEKAAVSEGKNNVVRFQDVIIDPLSYSEAIQQGFMDGYRLLMNNREELLSINGPIHSFSEDRARHVLRPTHVYEKFLDTSTQPKYLEDGAIREMLFDYLWSLSEHSKKSIEFIQSEIDDLLIQDVPYFTFVIGGKALYDSSDKTILNFYEKTSMELVHERIHRFSEEDLAKQLRYIKLSLSTLVENIWEKKPIDPTAIITRKIGKDLDIKVESKQIADSLINISTIDNDNEEMFWISTNIDGDQKVSLSPLHYGLYDGVMGIAIYFAQMGEYFGESDYTNNAKNVLNAIKKEKAFILQHDYTTSAYHGIGSLIYGFSYLGQLWKDKALIEESLSFLPYVEKKFHEESSIDFIGGHAGLLKILANLYEIKHDLHLKELIKKISKHLIKNTSNVIESKRGLLTGFAHGLTGIAFSLSKAYKITKDEEIKAFIIKLLITEDEYFSKEDKNWIDLRDEKHEVGPVYWCHGAAGILLGRTSIKKNIPSIEVDLKIEPALQTVLQNSIFSTHSLCHGELGNIDILIDYLSTHSVSDSEKEQIESRIHEIRMERNSKWLTGLHKDIEVLGLLVGISGIGYSLLRVSDSQIPSVLSLDLPVWRDFE